MIISINYLKRYDNSILASTLYDPDFTAFSPIGGYDPLRDACRFKEEQSVVYLTIDPGDTFEFKGKVVYSVPSSNYSPWIYSEYVEVEFNH